MRKLPLIFLICVLPGISLRAQSPPSAVQDAWLITRMAEKYHIEPRPLDQTLSSGIYTQLLDALDGQHIFFTKEGIGKLSAYRYRLNEEISNRQSGFLTLLISLYKTRLSQVDTMLDRIARVPFNFSIHEKLTAAEDTSHPSDISGIYIHLYKLLKSSVLSSILKYDPQQDRKPSIKYIDSLEPILRKRT